MSTVSNIRSSSPAPERRRVRFVAWPLWAAVAGISGTVARYTRSIAARLVSLGIAATAAGLILGAGWRGALANYLGPEAGLYGEDGLFVYYMLTDFGAYLPWYGVLIAAFAVAWMAWVERNVSRVLGAVTLLAAVGTLAQVLATGVPGLPGVYAPAWLAVAGIWLAASRSRITEGEGHDEPPHPSRDRDRTCCAPSPARGSVGRRHRAGRRRADRLHRRRGADRGALGRTRRGHRTRGGRGHPRRRARGVPRRVPPRHARCRRRRPGAHARRLAGAPVRRRAVHHDGQRRRRQRIGGVRDRPTGRGRVRALRGVPLGLRAVPQRRCGERDRVRDPGRLGGRRRLPGARDGRRLHAGGFTLVFVTG